MTSLFPLLWRRHRPLPAPATGRPPKLTVDAVIDAAIAAADADGLDATSMNRLSGRLGVGTMTLYGYVPSHSDLLDLMVDEVLTRHALPGPGEPRETAWPDRIRAYAVRTRAMYRTHLWLARITGIRPPTGPGMLAEREYVLSAVTGIGLPTGSINRAALTITAFVTAEARSLAERAQVERDSGITTEQWWAQRGELWEDWFDVDRHPAMTALWNAGGFDDDGLDAAYAYGLELIIDGIARDCRADGISPG